MNHSVPAFLVLFTVFGYCCLAADDAVKVPLRPKPESVEVESNAAELIVGVSIGTFHRIQYSAIMTLKDLEDAPKWFPELGPLPIKAADAESMAIDHVEKVIGTEGFFEENGRHYSVFKTSIARAGHSNLWFFEISLMGNQAGTGAREQITVLVTFGKKVIPIVRQ